MQRNKQHIEGFNLLFIFIVIGAMMAMLVGCVLVVNVPTKLPNKDTVHTNGFKTGAYLNDVISTQQ